MIKPFSSTSTALQKSPLDVWAMLCIKTPTLATLDFHYKVLKLCFYVPTAMVIVLSLLEEANQVNSASLVLKWQWAISTVLSNKPRAFRPFLSPTAAARESTEQV